MAIAAPEEFFKQKRNASEIKAEILPQYFKFWAENKFTLPRVSSQNLIYADLQAGLGYDAAEKPTTPLLLLSLIADSFGKETEDKAAIQIYFYDSATALLTQLQENIANLFLSGSLSEQPLFLTTPEEQTAFLEGLNQKPALLTLDPFTGSYPGKVLAATQPTGNADFFMVFSYQKMRQAVLAPEPREEMLHLFGSRLSHIQHYEQTEKSARKREQFLVETFAEVLQDKGYLVLTFKINLPGKDQTSHYLMLAAGDTAGYLGLKEILHPYSDKQEDGVPLFRANQKEQPPLLPGFFRLLSTYSQENLAADLAGNKSRFHYKTLAQIYAEHSIGTPYIKKNYKIALIHLMEIGQINLVDFNNRKVKQITDETVVFYKLHVSKK